MNGWQSKVEREIGGGGRERKRKHAKGTNVIRRGFQRSERLKAG